MIRVTVELVKHGLLGSVTKLAVVQIVNTGDGTETLGEYRATQLDKHGKPCRRSYSLIRHRRKAESVLKLVAKALEALGHGSRD